jgi:hypothetical protein
MRSSHSSFGRGLIFCRRPARPQPCGAIVLTSCESRKTASSKPNPEFTADQTNLSSSADYINRPHRLARLQGVLSTRHTPLRNDQCALHVLLAPRVGHGGDRSYLLVGTGKGALGASHVNYRHGADRCSVAGSGGGSGSLKILAGVLVHRATRPQERQSVLFRVVVAGLGTLCVDSTLTLSQT